MVSVATWVSYVEVDHMQNALVYRRSIALMAETISSLANRIQLYKLPNNRF
jgi:hypothetical protein